MFRDFSESAKEKLLAYVTEVTETSIWGKIGDAIGDAGLYVQSWFGLLNIQKYVGDLDDYQKKVIDMNDITKSRIEEIFAKVNGIDERYGKGLTGELNISDKILQFIKHLSETIDPNGGNLDMKRMGNVLQADIEEIQESRATQQQEIENQMLGTDPEAVHTSIDPVNLSTGNFIYEHRDLSIGGESPLYLHRYYNSKDAKVSSMGRGFRHNYDITLQDNGEKVDIVLEDGCHLYFVKEKNLYVGKNTVDELLMYEDGVFRLQTEGGIVLTFDKDNRISRREDKNGVGLTFLYGENGCLTEVRNDFGDCLRYCYGEDRQLVSVTDHTGRTVRYEYQGNKLCAVIDCMGRKISYEYSVGGKVSETYTGKEKTNIYNEYDGKARVTKQKFGDGSSMSFVYDDKEKTVTQIERNGVKTVYVHDDHYRNTEIRYEDGTIESYLYNEKGLCIKFKNRAGNTQRMSYDNRGNLIQKIDSLKRRINFTYNINNSLLSMSVNGKKILQNHYDRKGNLISTEDYYGNRNNRTLDSKGRIVSVTEPDGAKEEYTYDEKGNIRTFKNHFGGVTFYEYDDLHRVTKIIEPLKGESVFTYTTNGKVATETNAEGYTKKYVYNDKGLLTEIIDYNGASTRRKYNAINQLCTYTDEYGNQIQVTYDSMWNISAITLPNGATTAYFYDRDNQLCEIKDALGNVTVFKYDLNGNCISEMKDGTGCRFEYDAVGRRIKTIDFNGAESRYQYDDNDNLTHIVDAAGMDIEMVYDEANRMTEQRNSLGEIRKFTYTADGKMKTVTDEYHRVTEYFYIPGEKKYSAIIYPDGQKEVFHYDVAGNLTEYIDRAGNKITAEYDCMNRLISNYVNGKRMKTLSYDSVGNVIRVIDGEGAITSFEYSLKNELTKVINAEGSIIEYQYDNVGSLIQKNEVTSVDCRTTSYRYDLLGRIIGTVDPMGNKEMFSYDSFDHLIEKIDKEGYHTRYEYTKAGNISKVCFDDGRTVEMIYNALNHVEEIRDWTGVTRVKNDALGRALSVEYPSGESVSYAYNTAGKRTEITYPSGKKVKYQYDSLMRLEALISDSHSLQYKYDLNGRLKEKISSIGNETEYTYDSRGFLQSIINRKNEKILDRYDYEYDSYGRKTALTKIHSDYTAQNGKYTYQYDCLGRMTEVNRDGQPVRSYAYDSFGNRISMTQGTEVVSYKYNQLNQLISKKDRRSEEKFCYDKRGNLISVSDMEGMRKSYEFGAINRMEKATDSTGLSAVYVYNGLGCRVQKNILGRNVENHISYLVDLTKYHDNLLQKKTSQNADCQNYIWDERLVAISQTDRRTECYCVLDDLGSPLRLFDENGETVEIYDFDEFGQETTVGNISINPFTYTGYQRDEIAGTYFAQAREYLPDVGRFSARDLIAGEPEDILSNNAYLYCKDDPNNYIDQNGMFGILAAIGFGALAGMVINASVNGVSQEIKRAQGVQEEFNWGEFCGSGVSGAIIGGCGAAVPGVKSAAAAFLVEVIGGATGAFADSAISQGIDKGSVNWGQAAGDAAGGAIFAGISHGIGKLTGALKTKIFGERETSGDIFKKLTEFKGNKLKSAQDYYNQVIASGHKPSSKTRRILEAAKNKVRELEKKYWKTWGWEKCLEAVVGKEGFLRSGLRTIVGYDTTETVVNKLFGILFSESDIEGILDGLEEHFGTLYGKVTGKCPIYI